MCRRLSAELGAHLHYTESMTAQTSGRGARFGTLGLAATLIAATAMAASGSSAPGPEPGTTAPSFEALDQEGVRRDFQSLAGENGLLLLFFRSADW